MVPSRRRDSGPTDERRASEGTASYWQAYSTAVRCSANLIAQLNATISGFGIAVLPHFMASAHPELQAVLPDEVTITQVAYSPHDGGKTQPAAGQRAVFFIVATAIAWEDGTRPVLRTTNTDTDSILVLGDDSLPAQPAADTARLVRAALNYADALYNERDITAAPLLKGNSQTDKDKATASLGLLDKVRAFPTTIFLDAQGQVRAVYTGFSGPATGAAYAQQHTEFVRVIEGLLGG